MAATKDRILPVHEDGKKIYDTRISNDFSARPAALREAGIEGHRICIVADSQVAPLYADEVKALCSQVASAVCVWEFPAGEENKNLDTVRHLYEYLIRQHFDRKDTLVALGGGVTGDLTGFTAATYLRGISFVQIPTSLLAQVDSSIGGKTGVDFDAYKNMVGAFHMPKLVYINLRTLKTLPDQQFYAGMGEVIKHGFIKDRAYLDQLIAQADQILAREPDILSAVIGRSCEIKREVVENDPFEQGDRALLNFGHTLGHAIEKLKDFQMLHGECVSVGSVAAAWLSWQRGNISEADYETVREATRRYHLPLTISGLAPEAILQATKSDKKMESGTIRFVLLRSLGDAYTDKTVTDEQLLQAIAVIEEA